MSNATVYVKNISAQTEDKEVRDFFSFCGKITSLDVTTEGETKSATVTFEKDTASKTALLLNNTQLGPTHISVTSATGSSPDEAETHVPTNADRDSDEITQEEKPRSRIIAEYLAHGYVVGDAAIQSAIELDHKHDVSTRFFNKLTELNGKYHATDRAKATDETYGISQRATTFSTSVFTGLNSYFEKASNTPTGKKLVDFYTQRQKELQDVHTEARRLAELKKEEHGGSAYKAAGLERVFGAEKSKTEASSSTPTTETTEPAKPAAEASSAIPQPEKSG